MSEKDEQSDQEKERDDGTKPAGKKVAPPSDRVDDETPAEDGKKTTRQE